MEYSQDLAEFFCPLGLEKTCRVVANHFENDVICYISPSLNEKLSGIRRIGVWLGDHEEITEP